MTYAKDITDKIESDFGDKASDVLKIFEEAISKTDYLNHSRIIRCILFLAEKDIDRLKKNIQIAVYDPRDVMLWAEFAKLGLEGNQNEFGTLIKHLTNVRPMLKSKEILLLTVSNMTIPILL